MDGDIVLMDIQIANGSISTTYGGRDSILGFVAIFGARNEEGIGESISVCHKGELSA